MLPKRKIIKKRHQRPNPNNYPQESTSLSLLQKLRSPNNSDCEEALALVASLCVLGQSPKEIALLGQLLALLRRAPPQLVPQCLFGLANLCEVNGWAVGKLIELGLSQVLVKIDPSNQSILRPILVLILAMHPWLPESHTFLQRGLQNWIRPEHLLEGADRELVLEFLVVLGNGAPESLWGALVKLLEMEQNLFVRSMAGQVLLQFPGRHQVGNQIVELWDELLGDIDLQKEYQTNLLSAKPAQKQATQAEGMEEEEASPTDHPNYVIFTNTLQAVEATTQAILDLFEENWHGSEDENEHGAIQAESQPSDDPLVQAALSCLQRQWRAVARNTALLFPQGSNLVALSLRLLSHCGLENQVLNEIVVDILRKVSESPPPQDALNEILTLGTHLLLRCGVMAGEQKELILKLGQTIMRVTQDHKDAWIRLLELYSIHFNPQKVAVSWEANYRLGTLLKKLIVNIPYLRLQEWRAQTLDTLFDVYCNQQFDKTFLELGLPQLLEQVRSAGKQQPPKQRFLKQVMSDLSRFMAYKQKMIGW